MRIDLYEVRVDLDKIAKIYNFNTDNKAIFRKGVVEVDSQTREKIKDSMYYCVKLFDKVSNKSIKFELARLYKLGEKILNSYQRRFPFFIFGMIYQYDEKELSQLINNGYDYMRNLRGLLKKKFK